MYTYIYIYGYITCVYMHVAIDQFNCAQLVKIYMSCLLAHAYLHILLCIIDIPSLMGEVYYK